MDKNLDLVADELFGKLRTQFPKIRLGDTDSKVTDDPSTARFFEFDFDRNGVALGSISVNISETDGLVITYSNDIIENQPSGVKKHWFNFLKELREFAKQNVMNFETRDIAKTNLDKRDYKFLAKQHGESKMTESKLWGGNKTSYQDLGETRLIIKHSQPVNTELAAGRTMHIESIYVENQVGERFRYPHRHLNGARAMAEHIAHGGNPYDDIGQHIVSLSEEMSSLRKFKGYVNRTPVVSEAMGAINNRVIERLEEIKKEIHNLQRSSYYEPFAESFIKSESKEIPEDIVNDWIDRLTIRTFNEELKNVFPYIYNLVGEEINPIITVNPEEFLGLEDVDSTEQVENEIEEFINFETYLNKLVGEGADIFSNDQQSQQAAIDKLNQLVSQDFPVGTDGSNAIQSLSGIIDDNELNDIFKELADVNPESDVRDILKDYIKIKDEENSTDVLSQISFGSETPEPEAPEAPAAPAAPEPAAAAAAPAPSLPMSPGVAMEDNIKRVIERAKKAGMTAEDTFTLGGREITLADAIKHVGLDINEFFDQGYQDSGDELVEFVRSMFDEETGHFPKGETGVLLSVEKKFGDDAVKKASQVMKELNYSAESGRIRELSGLKSAQNYEESFSDTMKDLGTSVRRTVDRATLPAAMRADYDRMERDKEFANRPTVDQAKQDPRYKTDPEYRKEVDKADAFASAFGKPAGMKKEAEDDGRDLLDLVYGVATGGKRRPDPTPSGTRDMKPGQAPQKPEPSNQTPPVPSPSYIDKLKKLAGVK